MSPDDILLEAEEKMLKTELGFPSSVFFFAGNCQAIFIRPDAVSLLAWLNYVTRRYFIGSRGEDAQDRARIPVLSVFLCGKLPGNFHSTRRGFVVSLVELCHPTIFYWKPRRRCSRPSSDSRPQCFSLREIARQFSFDPTRFRC